MLRPLLFSLLMILPAAAPAEVIRPVSEKSSFQIALEGERPVLVLFQGKNCAACRAVEQWIDQLSGELDGKVDIVSLDIDENPYTKEAFGVEGTPTLLMFKDGEQVGGMVGATAREDLRAFIAKSAHIPL
ncbi:thioredoxin [Sphingomonas fennica]|uniref:Thioredoxin n=3 Tax=Alphaproteobacteria TaxID=28211 RepID=A0A2T4HW43_9SPHN|nr:thioredoxin [Sphingomonas sp. MM-1]OHT21104.1 Thioredoxin C-1 [Sphingomonas haloaromaticamans]PTD20012.1 thioredoxin [Sphingomonas fennica]